MGLKKLLKKLKKEKEVIAGEATKDKVYSSDQSFPTREEAVREFQRSVEKLFDVNRWSNMPGITSTFQMYDADGVEKHATKPQANDFIKIILPGPTPENWVMVTNLEENEESAEFTVSPSINPTEKEENQDEIAHFFIAEATSTFKVLLEGNQISAYEIGRNEGIKDRKSTRLNSSHVRISYAVFCL